MADKPTTAISEAVVILQANKPTTTLSEAWLLFQTHKPTTTLGEVWVPSPEIHKRTTVLSEVITPEFNMLEGNGSKFNVPFNRPFDGGLQ